MLETEAEERSNVGEYDLNIRVKGVDWNGIEYRIIADSAPATLTIDKAPITVTADNQTRSYGAANPTLTATVTTGTLFFGDQLSGSLTTPATAQSNVGKYDIEQGTLTAGGNYDLQYNKGELTVTAAPITVTANAVSRSYGSSNPSLGFTLTSGTLYNNNTLGGTLTTTANASSNVGSYTINAGSLHSANTNYAITYVSKDLTVTPAAITVTATTQTKSYGTTAQGLAYQLTGGTLFGSDHLTGHLSTASGSTPNVGTHAITIGSLSAGTNYAINFVSADLSVTKAALQITANAQTRTYGESNPKFTYQITSGQLFNDDRLVGALASTASQTSGIGIYQINQGNLSAGTNYSLTFIGSQMSIAKAQLAIHANNQNHIITGNAYAIGDIDQSAFTYIGFMNGEGPRDLGGQLIYGGTALGATSPGTYTLELAGLSSANYDITYQSGTISLLPAIQVLIPPPPGSVNTTAVTSVSYNKLLNQIGSSQQSTGSETAALNNPLLTQRACFSANGWAFCGELD